MARAERLTDYPTRVARAELPESVRSRRFARRRARALADPVNGSFNELSFEFTQTSQTGAGTYSPAFRLNIDAGGDLSTTNDRGELVFEYAYQGEGDLPLNQTIHALLTGDDGGLAALRRSQS